MKKISELADQIGMQPEDLFKKLVTRGLEIISVDREVDSATAEAIINAHNENSSGEIDFDRVLDRGVTDEFSLNGHVDIKQFSPRFGKLFELQVGSLISHYFPNSHLSSVFLYIAKLLTNDEKKFGREMDHLMHIKDDNVNRLLIIECKAQEIKPDAKRKRWLANYDSGQSDVRRQMMMQAKAVHQMIKPVPGMNLEIYNVAVSSSEVEPGLTHNYEEQGVPVFLEVLSIKDFADLLDHYSTSPDVQVFRIFQSELLRRLRQGKPCEHQGHPDIRDAIEYHKRVRLTMDWALFDHFKPSIDKWAINGTAGMGKTVLLAYSACVLSCDHVLKYDEGTGFHRLEKFDGKQKNIPYWKDRKIVVYAIQPKQVSVIRKFFDLFQRLFQENDQTYQISRFLSVDFKVWENKNLEGNVVLIDEAHDLCSESQARISEWCKLENKYLIIACDRHQKLRLTEVGDQERMISGLDFSGCSKKLSRIYRNPFSVYAAGLSLMFRWFSADGPKVIPPVERLTDSFGFDVKRRDLRAGMGCLFEMVEDAHPANNWHQCVSNFPDAETAYNWFQQYKIESNDVLWVRFSSEDRTFDYPKLRKSFEYLDLELKAARAYNIDKYIKGQEFSVVVIEGVGSDFNNIDDVAAMLEHRRELYLCASRATLFLFFILNKDSDGIILKEFEDLRTALSKPLRPSDATQFWGLKFDANQNKTISFSEYQDIVDPIEISEPEPELGFETKPPPPSKTEPEAEDSEPASKKNWVRVHAIAKEVKRTSDEIIKILAERGLSVTSATSLVDPIIAQTLIDELLSSAKINGISSSDDQSSNSNLTVTLDWIASKTGLTVSDVYGRLKKDGVSLYIGAASKINKNVALGFIEKVSRPKPNEVPQKQEKEAKVDKQHVLSASKLIELENCLNSIYGLLKRFALYPRKPENETQRELSILVLTQKDYEPDESGGQFCKQLKRAHREMIIRINRFKNTGIWEDISFNDAELYLESLTELLSVSADMFTRGKAKESQPELSTLKLNNKPKLLLELNKKLSDRRKQLMKFGEPDHIFQAKISAFAKKLPAGFKLNSDKTQVLVVESN